MTKKSVHLSWESQNFVDSIRHETESAKTRYQNRKMNVVAWQGKNHTLKVNRFDAEQVASVNSANILHNHTTGDFTRVFRVAIRFTLSTGQVMTKTLATLGINSENRAFLLSGSNTAKIANGTGEDFETLQEAIKTVAKAHRLATDYRTKHNESPDTVQLPDDSFYRPIASASVEINAFVHESVAF